MADDDSIERSISAFEQRRNSRLTNAEFDRLVAEVGNAAAGGQLAACELLGRWLADERSDARRTEILDVMAASSCWGVSIDLLVRLLKVPNDDVSSAAARLLVLSGADGETAMVRTLPEIRGSFSRFRCLATLLYRRAQLKNENTKVVCDFVKVGSPDLRLAGLTVLALRGDESCTEQLIESLGRRDASTREAALKALVAVGNGRAVDAVLARIEKDAARVSDPHSAVIELELNYLAQHAALRPEAFQLARDAVARNWRRRDDAELKWMRVFLRQSSPDGLRTIGIPSESELQRMRDHVLDRMRAKDLPPDLKLFQFKV